MSIRAVDRAADRRRARLDPGRRRRDPRRRDPPRDLAAQVHDRHLDGGDAPGRTRWGCARRPRWCSASASEPQPHRRTTSSGCARCRTRPRASPPSSAGRSRPRGRGSSCATTPRRCATCACSRCRASTSTTSPACRSRGRRWAPRSGRSALRFGGNDFGSAMIEENVVSQAGADLQALRRGHRALHPRRRLRAAPPQHALRAAAPPPERRTRDARSAARAWSSLPGSSDHAAADRRGRGRRSTTTARCSTSAARAESARASPGRARGARRGRACCPALVNAHCHLELSALAGAVPGGGGPHRLGDAAASRWSRDARPDARRARPPTAAAAAMVAAGTAAVGDVGNTPGRGARQSAPPACAAIFFHELVGSRDARDGRRARRRRPRARRLADRRRRPAPGRMASATCPRPTPPTPSGPSSSARSSHAPRAPACRRRSTSPRTATRSRCCATAAARWPAVLAAHGRRRRRRASPGQPPVAYLASLGAFDGRAPPLLVHMVHADADDRRRAREAGATAVLCPRSNLHIGGGCPTSPALLADGVRLALGTDSLASTPDLSLVGRDGDAGARASRRCPPRPGSRPPPAAAPSAMRPRRAAAALTPGKRPGVLDVMPHDRSRAAPLEPRWCAIPTPHRPLDGPRMTDRRPARPRRHQRRVDRRRHASGA